jgi:hypothetical protein
VCLYAIQQVANLGAKTSALEVENCRLEVVNFRRGSWQLLGGKFLEAILRQNRVFAPVS